MKWHTMFVLVSILIAVGCAKIELDDSTYVLIRNSTNGGSTPALRAYFMDGGAQLNRVSCKEILDLTNEAVETRISRGETHLVKYECVSLREARERGFKPA